jgi:hypothetical protein
MLEREMPHAHALVEEARALSATDPGTALHLTWGSGLLARFRGETAAAREQIGAALRLARATQDHWAECEALMTLTIIALELGEAPRALAWSAELAPVAARMGEGSEGPAAEALAALASVASGNTRPEDDARLDRAIARLREIDAKGILSLACNHAARLAAARGSRDAARTLAHEALKAAEVVERRTQAVLAHATLGDIARAEGDRAEAARRLDLIRADVAAPLLVSAHARAAAFALADALGASIEGDRPCPT